MPAPAGRWGSPEYLALQIQRQQKEDELKERQYAYKIEGQNELDSYWNKPCQFKRAVAHNCNHQQWILLEPSEPSVRAICAEIAMPLSEVASILDGQPWSKSATGRSICQWWYLCKFQMPVMNKPEQQNVHDHRPTKGFCTVLHSQKSSEMLKQSDTIAASMWCTCILLYWQHKYRVVQGYSESALSRALPIPQVHM